MTIPTEVLDRIREEARRDAEAQYPAAWGPSPGGMSVDHNHIPRKAHAACYERLKVAEWEREQDPWVPVTKDSQPPHGCTVLYWHKSPSGGYMAIADEWSWYHHGPLASHFLPSSITTPALNYESCGGAGYTACPLCHNEERVYCGGMNDIQHLPNCGWLIAKGLSTVP